MPKIVGIRCPKLRSQWADDPANARPRSAFTLRWVRVPTTPSDVRLRSVRPDDFVTPASARIPGEPAPGSDQNQATWTPDSVDQPAVGASSG